MLNVQHQYLSDPTPPTPLQVPIGSAAPQAQSVASAPTTERLVQDWSDVRTLMNHRKHVPSIRAQRYLEVVA
jgi:hypothetical protein